MNNTMNSPSEGLSDPLRLRDLHMQYWMISQQGHPDFPQRTMEEFVVFFEGLDDRAQTEYVVRLRELHEHAVERMVEEGVRIIEEFSEPESDKGEH